MRKINVTSGDIRDNFIQRLLHENEYFLVEIADHNGMKSTCALAKDDDADCYLLSNLNRFDGCHSGMRDELGFRYSWQLCTTFLEDFLEEYSYNFVGFPTSDTTPVVADEPCSFVNNNYRTDTTYMNVNGYHSRRSYNEPLVQYSGHRIGVELEVECNSRSIKEHIDENFKSNWLIMERDGSLTDNGIEFITIPMVPKHIKAKNTWFDFIEYMSSRATSWSAGTCGLHVHIGREILGKTAEVQSETIGKLLYLYHHHLKEHQTNIKIYGRERAYNDHDGKVEEGKAVKLLGSEVLQVKSVKDTLKDKLVSRTMCDRYFDINLRNEATIEFRKGRGSLNVDRIISVIEYSELMCKYAKDADWDEISAENFFAYIKKAIKRTSPLQRYFCQELDA